MFLGAAQPAISPLCVEPLVSGELVHNEFELQAHREQTCAVFMRMRGAGNPPQYSSIPPRPPDVGNLARPPAPDQSWFSNPCQYHSVQYPSPPQQWSSQTDSYPRSTTSGKMQFASDPYRPPTWEEVKSVCSQTSSYSTSHSPHPNFFPNCHTSTETTNNSHFFPHEFPGVTPHTLTTSTQNLSIPTYHSPVSGALVHFKSKLLAHQEATNARLELMQTSLRTDMATLLADFLASLMEGLNSLVAGGNSTRRAPEPVPPDGAVRFGSVTSPVLAYRGSSPREGSASSTQARSEGPPLLQIDSSGNSSAHTCPRSNHGGNMPFVGLDSMNMCVDTSVGVRNDMLGVKKDKMLVGDANVSGSMGLVQENVNVCVDPNLGVNKGEYEPHHELASLNLVSSLPEYHPSQISPESDWAEVSTVDSSYSSFTPGTNDVDVTDFDLDVTEVDVDVTDICSKLPDMVEPLKLETVEKHGSSLDCLIAKANDSSSATTAMPQETKDVECYKHECEPVYGVCKFGTTRMRVNDIIHPSVDLMIMDNHILNGSIGFLNGNIGEGNLSAGDIYEGNAEELHSAVRGDLKLTNDMMLLSADAQLEVRLCMCCFQFCHGGTRRFLRWHRQAYDTMCARSHTTLISNFHNGESAFESSFSVMLAPYFNCLNGDVGSDNWSHAEWLEKMLMDAGNLLLDNMSAGEMHPDSSLIFTGWDTDNSIDVASLGTDMIYMSPNMTELFPYWSLVNVSLPKVFSMAPDEKNGTCICRWLLYWLYLCHCKEKVSTGVLNACLNGDIDCLPRESKMVQVSLFHAHTLEKLILLLADELETIRHQFLLHNSADAMFEGKDGNFLYLKSRLGLVCVVNDKSVELELVEFLKRILSQGLVYLPEEISALTFAKPPPTVTLFVGLIMLRTLLETVIVTQTVGAAILPLVMPFVEANIVKPDWCSQDAATMVFSSILEGLTIEKLSVFVHSGLDFLLALEGGGKKHSGHASVDIKSVDDATTLVGERKIVVVRVFEEFFGDELRSSCL